MYADCMFSSRLHAEGQLEEQFKRWVEFYRDSEEVTPNPLLYVFDTVAYRGVIRGSGGGTGTVTWKKEKTNKSKRKKKT